MSMGKGLEAILKAPDKLKRVEATEVSTEEVNTAQVTTGKVTTEERDAGEGIAKKVAVPEEPIARVNTSGVTIRKDVIEKAISDAKRSPRISTWSPLAVGTLKSLWMTQPQFSMSDEIRTLIEEGLAKKYPELVETIKKELEKS
jgi:hypothetical protein